MVKRVDWRRSHIKAALSRRHEAGGPDWVTMLRSPFSREPLPPIDYRFRVEGDRHARILPNGETVSLPRVRFLEA